MLKRLYFRSSKDKTGYCRPSGNKFDWIYEVIEKYP